MYLRSSIAFSAATALAFSSLISSATAAPAGAVALEAWFSQILPEVFPNTTDKWRPLFHDGTFASDVHFSVNDWTTIDGVSNLEDYFTTMTGLVVNRTDSYFVVPSGISAYAIDAEGKNGWIVATGTSTLTTKAGDVYTDGIAGTYIQVKWNETLGKRSVASWTDIGTPPNYPNYPWN